MKFYMILFSFLLVAGIVKAEEIKIVTEHWPPFQVVEKGKNIDGFSVKIVQEMLKETGVKARIKAYPWPRAYNMALKDKNVLIFSITRTEEREALFKWVGPIIGLGDSLWKLKSRKDISLNSLDDAKRYKIGVPRDDNQHQFLKQKGFKDTKHLKLLRRWDQTIQMLYKGRVDLIMGSELPIAYRVKGLKLDSSKLEQAYEIGQQWGDLSIAFSKSTSDELVQQFRTALEKIKNEGTFDKIRTEWEGGMR